MLIETARRAHAAAKETLALVNEGSASCAEMREMLEESKAAVAALVAAQTSAAASIAGRERHGDGGTQVLADAAGLSQRDARSQVKTAQVIEAVPAVRDAVESGRVSQANARRLADAVEKTSAADVASDGDLLANAESMRPEQFVREARRWTADHQADGGAADYRRLRSKRSVRVFDGDDGMVHLRGEFDPVTGKRIASRLRAQARHLYDADREHAADNDDAERRSFDQCMADALDNLTNITSARQGTGKPLADICVVAHVDDDTGELIAELPDGERLPQTVLEQLSCNAKLTGVVYDRKGKPIWRTESRRTVTESQWQLLVARWGGCFHCGANPGICQGHHIEPASRGGPTKLDNLVPACWTCHHRIHHDGWRMHKRPDGNHTLHPPDTVSFGSARAPDHVPALFKPGTQHDPDPPPPPPRPAPSRGEPGSPASPYHEPLLALT
ncbi:MAG: HNH endonuclease [Acidimicrobiaceae bacterium]|nr:HNH endonuclease [Acidimicrobiaceae bacterium]